MYQHFSASDVLRQKKHSIHGVLYNLRTARNACPLHHSCGCSFRQFGCKRSAIVIRLRRTDALPIVYTLWQHTQGGYPREQERIDVEGKVLTERQCSRMVRHTQHEQSGEAYTPARYSSAS